MATSARAMSARRRAGRDLLAPPASRDVRGVLLDVDGTLADTSDAHARAWQTALREAGHDVAWARIRRLARTGADKLVPRAIGLSESDPKARWIVARRAAVFLTRELPNVQPMPGARDLLLRMRRERLAWSLVTSARTEEVRLLLERAGVADLVAVPPASTSREPSSSGSGRLGSALDRLGLPPRDVVMLGASPCDLEDARREKVGSVLFRNGGWPDSQLAGVLAIYDGPWDLLARFDESVFRRWSAPRAAAAFVGPELF
jgi:phosphoglycolate phosphatase-like HAD superfamily hydrolase